MKSFTRSAIVSVIVAASLAISPMPANAAVVEFVTLTGAASQPLGFLAAAGSLVICEGKVVNNKCDNAGVSDVATFKNDTVGWDSDPKETLETAAQAAADNDASSALADVPGTHKAEGDLLTSTYDAITSEDPGFDLSTGSPVIYSFAPSALVDIPEPPSLTIWYPILAALCLHLILRGHQYRRVGADVAFLGFAART
jgi:hypothetical protein